MDCANNTCQKEVDYSPAPIKKTGVVEVISQSDKYKYD